MKLFIIFTSCLVFAVPRAVTADDTVLKKSAPQRNVHSPARIHTSAVRMGRNGFAGQTNPNFRLNNAAFLRPIQHARLGMNVRTPFQNSQHGQRPAGLPPGQKVNMSRRTFQAASDNRQNGDRRSYFDALKRCRHERHDCNWWKQHCTTIVFVRTGYYYLDAGYWYPAYGYDPAYDYYDYDGPIYTYGNLLPDQVIANVQNALRDLGYYLGPVSGSINQNTRAALANFQRDYGLIITGAIDEPTVASLGLG